MVDGLANEAPASAQPGCAGFTTLEKSVSRVHFTHDIMMKRRGCQILVAGRRFVARVKEMLSRAKTTRLGKQALPLLHSCH